MEESSIFTPAFARILLFVLSGWLTARGMPADLSYVLYDPAVTIGVEALVGIALGAVTFGFWRLAKRLGWRT